MDQVLLDESLSLFSKVSIIVTGFVAAVFVLRAVILQVRVEGSSEYGELLQDLVSYFGMTALFPYLIKLMMGSIAQIASKISVDVKPVNHSEAYHFFKDLFGDYVIVELLSKAGDVIVMFIIQGVYSILIALLIAIAPIIIFNSTVLKVTSGLKEYFNIWLAIGLE